MNCLIGQRVNAALQKALDVAISRFEAGDITGVVVGSFISSLGQTKIYIFPFSLFKK